MIDAVLFEYLVYGWIFLAILMLPLTLKITAPYGRHSSTQWGVMVNNRLAWILMELPSLVIFLVLIFTGAPAMNVIMGVIVIAWSGHYFYRAVIYPLWIRTGKKKMPALIMLFALIFNVINSFLNGYWFGFLSPGYEGNWILDPRFIIGILMFLVGFLIHVYHDRLLINLRKNGINGYQIPSGGLFRYISCPNFLGELIQWSGFAILTWCLPSFSFFLWTFVNLVPRALDHHKWYKDQFDNYPNKRKAIFPFIL